MRRKAQRRTAPGDGVTGSNLNERSGKSLHVLLVDTDAQERKLLAEMLAGQRVVLHEASSLAEARQLVGKSRVDVALINSALPDGSGIELTEELASGSSPTQTIVISGQPTLEGAVEAIRAGAVDFIAKPVDRNELSERVRVAIDRQNNSRQQERRVRRLRRICKKLNLARQEVTQQVDILCNDLVTAYQELASQMQHVVQASEFAMLVKDELDLEHLLRKTLEYLVQKTGPTNAAIFLPATAHEYTLGGYVNYDCSPDSADLLLQHLADVVAPRIAESDMPIHITDRQTMSEWLDDDVPYLADSHMLGFDCQHEDESLAVIVLFRDNSQPFDADIFETAGAIAPLLGPSLARIIRVHHRQIIDHPYDKDFDDEIPF